MVSKAEKPLLQARLHSELGGGAWCPRWRGMLFGFKYSTNKTKALEVIYS